MNISQQLNKRRLNEDSSEEGEIPRAIRLCTETARVRAESSYTYVPGEVVHGRYEVYGNHGSGRFSKVLRARDLQQPLAIGVYADVAIKVILAHEFAEKAEREFDILNKLAQSDPENKSNVIKLIGSFEHRLHKCLVFEPMTMNLRNWLKKFGRRIGLNTHAVRSFSIQLCIALNHLKNNGVLHADIKPENILVNESLSIVKICDFNSAILSGEVEIGAYLVPRYYRAPEIILGLKYDSPMDMWSFGCVIYELSARACVLFPGRTENEMLKLMMDVKGQFPKKMLRKGKRSNFHFDLTNPSTPAIFLEKDPSGIQPIKRIIADAAVKKTLYQILAGYLDNKNARQMAHLLERILMLDPDKRITPDQALQDPFCDVSNN